MKNRKKNFLSRFEPVARTTNNGIPLFVVVVVVVRFLYCIDDKQASLFIKFKLI